LLRSLLPSVYFAPLYRSAVVGLVRKKVSKRAINRCISSCRGGET
jgi:hypothetical protein